MTDQLATAIAAGAASALRKRATAQRDKAALGITEADGVTVIASEAKAALNIACFLASLALEIEKDFAQ